MSSSSFAQHNDAAQLTIHHNDQAVGLLIADHHNAHGNEGRQSYRFAALDRHFILLDGSRFITPHRAYAAVARLSQFVDRPPAANDA
ncbi:MAG TPA: hypothetical protein VN229_05655 [Terriglobales bacterium]|nr:hypothetical protein [Terriglobales bacterium]